MKSLTKKIVFKNFSHLEKGMIIVKEKNEEYVFGQKTSLFPKPIVITVHNSKFYNELVFGGSVGAAESYVLGDWECENLTFLFQIFLNNKVILDKFEKKFAKITACFRWIWHQFRSNTQSGSSRNISAHYDLSNDFFQLFLDSRLMYSSAIFSSENMSLEDAAVYKLDYICQKLKLKPTDKVIEIGAGWGGFAIHAAKHYGCEIVTTTISSAQYAFARKRIIENNLESKITLIKKDYRLLPEALGQKFNKLVSIEMIEAVGAQYFKKFFEVCDGLLQPAGELLLQGITIQDQEFGRAKHEVDFIKRYIFPGSCIPSITALLDAMTKASLLKLSHLEDIGKHYAKTLRIWQERLMAHREAVKKMGFDEKFLRLWRFYFSYCEAGFLEGYLGDVQMHCVKQAMMC